MIYRVPGLDDAVDQGDIVDDCPIVQIAEFDPEEPASPKIGCSPSRVVILTQTCDLANQKTRRVSVAVVHNAQFLVDRKIVRAASTLAKHRGTGGHDDEFKHLPDTTLRSIFSGFHAYVTKK